MSLFGSVTAIPKSLLALAGGASLFLASSLQTLAQALPAATGPGGGYTQVGANISAYQIDYGKRYLGGGGFYIDANLTARYGLEAEARTLHFNEDEGVSETTFLVGPRISPLVGQLRPYAKLLVGRGTLNYPFNYGQGSYFVIAPGFGLDWRVGNGRFTIRALDAEFQQWPGFSFGPLKPYGFSSGLAVRVF
jgi:hypothetical protein